MSKRKFYFGFFAMILIFCTFKLSATTTPSTPDNYNNQLDFNEVYIYNVTTFNTSKHLEWRELDWFAPPRGFVNTTPGGQILVNFTGYYDKDNLYSFNLFENPIPYMNIEFKENRLGILVTNNTFYNVSNEEADSNLLLGYNSFKSGFLIPNNNFTYLKQNAYAQDEPPFWNATVVIEENHKNISFDFRQTVFFRQRTNSIYDKASGLLIYTNNSVGNYTLEMTLTNLPDLKTELQSVPSYSPTITFMLFSFTTTILILIKKKKVKKQKLN